ncbi:MAG: ferric reductase-like transmembrane domain-containing protein [Pseudomonadota bacterium]
MTRPRAALIWAGVMLAAGVPVAAVGFSPLLAWREPIYIASGFAGAIGLALMLVQPLLIGGYLPGFSPYQRRRMHQWIGAALILAVIVHVLGLWITSPPDVVDALLFVSPTPFSVWGVVAMWAIFIVGLMVALRHRLRLRPRTWRAAHTVLIVVIVIGTVVHGLLIEGTMETITKAMLCALVLGGTLKVISDKRVWKTQSRHAPSPDEAA